MSEVYSSYKLFFFWDFCFTEHIDTYGSVACNFVTGAMVNSSAFAALLEYLEREEASLRALGCSDVRSLLKTGRATRTRVGNDERAHHYRMFWEFEWTLTAEQMARLTYWEQRICTVEDVATQS